MRTRLAVPRADNQSDCSLGGHWPVVSSSSSFRMASIDRMLQVSGAPVAEPQRAKGISERLTKLHGEQTRRTVEFKVVY